MDGIVIEKPKPVKKTKSRHFFRILTLSGYMDIDGWIDRYS